jgi:hypothetical protein
MGHMADRLAELTMTDWWPVRVALVVVLTVWRARRWYSRALLGTLQPVLLLPDGTPGSPTDWIGRTVERLP